MLQTAPCLFAPLLRERRFASPGEAVKVAWFIAKRSRSADAAPRLDSCKNNLLREKIEVAAS